MKVETQSRLEAQLSEELTPVVFSLLDWPGVEDIVVNPDGHLWTNLGDVNAGMDEGRRRAIIHTVAAMNGMVVNTDRPRIEAVLPFGKARFKGIVEPIVTAPVFAIRTRPKSVYALEDYVESETMTSLQYKALCAALVAPDPKTVLIVGPTGSGKTALLNACLKAVALCSPMDRILSIEDTPEIDCQSPNSTALLATGDTTMQECLRDALRMAPARIVVGEVRGVEALDLLDAWTTGHPGGVGTIHGRSALGGLKRIESLVGRTTEEPQQEWIAETIDLVVFIRKDTSTKSGRRVTEMKWVEGYENGQYRMTDI